MDNGRVGSVELTGAGRFAIIPSDCLGRKDRNPGKPILPVIVEVTLKSYCRIVGRGTGKFPVSKETHRRREAGSVLSLAMGFSFRRALGHGFRGELKYSKTHTPNGSRAFSLDRERGLDYI